MARILAQSALTEHTSNVLLVFSHAKEGSPMLSNPVPLAGDRIGYDVHEFLAALRDADLLQVTWPENGMRKGFDVFIPPLCASPNTLVLDVRTRREAFALRAAKIEIDNGNYYGAYQEMRALAEPGSSATH
jgi:hypothetical protein